MFSTSVIELDRAALRHNLRFLRRQLGPDCAFCSVVKGNAYGHGLEDYVPLAEEEGVQRFAVFSAAEALRVVTALRRPAEVMIMGAADPQELEWAIRHGVSTWVFDLGRLELARDLGMRLGKPARVHLELETGLYRTGLEEALLEKVAEFVREAGASLQVDGVCTHFAGAESVANYVRIRQQQERFEAMTAQLKTLGLQWTHRHTACSAAALTYPETAMDIARMGIAQYGYWPSRETRMHFQTSRGSHAVNPLRPVLTWRSRIMAVKKVPAGQFVGYGTTYLTEKAMKVAIVPVGYADGFARGMSNLGRVLIRGKRASVIGVVNMSALLVDVSRYRGVAPGDEVVLIGKQGRLSISVSSFSELTRTVDYETLTRLPRDIPRVRT